MNFRYTQSQPQLESSYINVIETPNIWDKKFKTEFNIFIHHFENSNELHVRLIFNTFSKNNLKYLTRFFDSLYKLDFKLDLAGSSLKNEILKVTPIVQDLISRFDKEYQKLSSDYDLPNLAALSSEALARKIIEDFDPSSDISHL